MFLFASKLTTLLNRSNAVLFDALMIDPAFAGNTRLVDREVAAPSFLQETIAKAIARMVRNFFMIQDLPFPDDTKLAVWVA